jgi:hypothetical protein
MANKNKTRPIEEKIQQALEKLGKSLEEVLGALSNQRQPHVQPVPVRVDRPYQKRRRM